MPGDLRDPEQSTPFHYDPRYEHKPRPLELLYPGPDMYIQTYAEQYRNKPLDRSEIIRVKEYLDEKGLLQRHWGDDSFRDGVIKAIKKLESARKVALRCLT